MYSIKLVAAVFIVVFGIVNVKNNNNQSPH